MVERVLQYVFLAVFALLALAGIFLLLRGLYRRSKDPSRRPPYDERQQLERGRAYRAAFFTLFIYESLYALVYLFLGRKIDALTWCSNYELIFTGVDLSLVVFAVYAIVKDAYTRVCDRLDAHLTTWTLLMVFYVGTSVLSAQRTGMFRLQNCWQLSWVVVVAALYIRRWQLKKEETE